MATASTWISKQPHRAGGDACVRDTRVTVWGLESYRRLGLPDDQILAATPGLTQADLDAAWEYVASHPREIDDAIQDNEAGQAGLVE